MKYRSKIYAEKNPSPGEVNNEPSMTIEGEHKEMKDILNYAIQGMDVPKTDVQYFRPEQITEINSLFRKSLDLTDLDALREKTKVLTDEVTEAYNRKKQLQKQQLVDEKKQQENENESNVSSDTKKEE